MRMVVFSPHRDDAAFSLSLAIDTWLSKGHRVHVVSCFTRSEYAPFSDAESLHANDRLHYVTALRLREDESWRRQFGAGLTMADLNLKDAPLRLRCGVEEVCGLEVNAADKAMVKIRKAVERVAGDAVLLPLALGDHVDHRTVREAGRLGLADETACAFYEDLPYATRPGVADSIAAVARELKGGLEPIFGGEAGDGAVAAERKRRVMLAYDSQVDGEGTRVIAEFSLRYGGRERLWANAAWRRLPGSDGDRALTGITV